MFSLDPKKKLFATIALHILVWGFWFAAPILFSFNNPRENEPPRDPNFFFFIWIPMFLSCILFYINYFLLIESLLFRKKILWFLVSNFVLIILFSYFSEIVREFFKVMIPEMGHRPKPPKESTLR